MELNTPLFSGTTYAFDIALARSPVYESVSQSTQMTTNFTTPAVLRIWGGQSECDKAELLGTSPTVFNTRWLKYDFNIQPTETVNFITLEAFYETPTLFPYNGNILLDDASAFVEK